MVEAPQAEIKEKMPDKMSSEGLKRFKKTMKILVVGSKGMLGSDLVEELNNTENEVISWDIADINIVNEEEINKISNLQPNLLINCAAYTNVEGAEREKLKCYSTNVIAVKNLIDICKKKDIILIQISTDYVFDGNKQSYNEDDEKKPLNFYGKTKADGEDLIINHLDKYYIIRTSWLFGKNGKNFVDIIIRLCAEKEKITVVSDQIGRPTYTKDLSNGIIKLISNMANHMYGIYHLTNSGICSWYEFAKEIARLKNLNCVVKPCTTEEFPTVAKRPKFSVLSNNKLGQLRPWKEALKDYLGA